MTYFNTPIRYLTGKESIYAYRELGNPQAARLVLLPHLAATMDNRDPAFIDILAQH